jgi:hypothetical protein
MTVGRPASPPRMTFRTIIVRVRCETFGMQLHEIASALTRMVHALSNGMSRIWSFCGEFHMRFHGNTMLKGTPCLQNAIIPENRTPLKDVAAERNAEGKVSICHRRRPTGPKDYPSCLKQCNATMYLLRCSH